MDIILINPGKITSDYMTEHVGLASLKAYINNKGFKADTIDMTIEKLSIDSSINRIMHINPKLAGISLLDDTKDKGLNLIIKLREAGYSGKIVVGGYFATFSSKEILRDFPQIDFVVRGEGEITLHELMDCVLLKKKKNYTHILGLSYRNSEKIIENSPRPLISNLDSLPFIDRKYAGTILDNNSRLRIYSTRGCWGQCTFCDIISMYGISKGKKWRCRSIKNLVDEIEYLVKKYNTNTFIFNDDQFLLKGEKGKERVENFAKEIEYRNLKIKFELMCRSDTINRVTIKRLKSVGLTRIFLGIESFNNQQLIRYQKGITKRQNLKALITLFQLQIDVIASVILADAYTKIGDLIKQFMVLFELKQKYFNTPYCKISINKKVDIYRGSPLYQEYLSKGLLTENHYLKGYTFKLKLLTAFRLKLFDLEEILFHKLIQSRLWLRTLLSEFILQLPRIQRLAIKLQ